MAAKAAAPLAQFAEAIACNPTAGEFDDSIWLQSGRGWPGCWTSVVLSCVTGHAQNHPHEALWGCLCQSYQSTAPDADAPINPGSSRPQAETYPNSRSESGTVQAATWSRYLIERQPREHYYYGTWTQLGQPDRRTRHSVVGESHQIFMPNSVCDGARRPARTTLQIFLSLHQLLLVDIPSVCKHLTRSIKTFGL